MTLLWLLGCSLFISDEALFEAIDLDGDGARSPAFGGGDCDDTDPTIYPGADDTPYDGVDANCDGSDDFDVDQDGLRAVEHGGPDCDDTDPLVGDDPTFFYADCDGDGVPAEHGLFACTLPELPLSTEADPCGGAPTAQFVTTRPGRFDCDDLSRGTFPGASDPWYDGVDSNCDGSNDYDADKDGFVADVPGARPDTSAPGLGDCNDADPSINPAAIDLPYDGVDADCRLDNDYDADGDGTVASSFPEQAGGSAPFTNDCDDTDDAVSPGGPDLPYDGLDANCDEANDYDADQDGWVPSQWAAQANGLEVGDCDDSDARRAPDNIEVYYDGVDGDCLDDNDFDADHDGVVRLGFQAFTDASAPLTGDCDDDNADVYPGANDPPYDGLDANCDGASEFDLDGDGYLHSSAGGPAATADCDDSDPAIFPGAPDTPYDGLDANCDQNNDYDVDMDGFVPDQWVNDSGLPGGDCDDLSSAVLPTADELWYDGVDQNCDGANDYDQDGDGVVRTGFDGQAGGTANLTGDCDDLEASIYPLATDVLYDGVDSDCAGDDDFDADGDGFRHIWAGGPLSDCDDNNASVFPGAPDTPYDGIDANCDESNDFDADGDGSVVSEDCDDNDPNRSPNTIEIAYDGIDGDCAGDNDFDADQDGYVGQAFPTKADANTLPGDCNDGDANVHPSANDAAYDGIDANCDGRNDFDQDGDGVVSDQFPGTEGTTAPQGDDCDDTRSDVHPGILDIAYDGLDADCGGNNDYDADADGFVPSIYSAQAGGTAAGLNDCDDRAAAVNPSAIETPYDGIDSDCLGDSDFDRDGDGFVAVGFDGRALPSEGVGDCDDTLAVVHPGQADTPYDGIDADCDGANDYDADADGFVASGFSAQAGGTAPFIDDCDDAEPLAHPGALDVPYDGIDADCVGDDDWDMDADGVVAGPDCASTRCDCDDTDPQYATGDWTIAPTEPLQPLVDNACDGSSLTLLAGIFPVADLSLSRPITLIGAGSSTVLLATSGRVLDVPGAPVQILDMVLQGGVADDGGSVRVQGTLALQNVTALAGVATGRGGLVFVDQYADLSSVNVVFDTGSAGYGGGVALAPGAVFTGTDLSFLSCDASFDGGGVHGDKSDLVLTQSVFDATTAGNDGGAVAVVDGVIDLDSIDVFNASAVSNGAALSINGSGGQVSRLFVTASNAATTTPSVGITPLPSVVNVDFAGFGYPLLSFEDIDLVGNTAFVGLSVYEPLSSIDLHDIRVEGDHRYGLNFESQTTTSDARATITAFNLLVVDAGYGARVSAFSAGNAARVSNATFIGEFVGLQTEVFSGEVTVTNVLASTTGFFLQDAVAWNDLDTLNGASQLGYTWVARGATTTGWQTFNPAQSWSYNTPPPFCDQCGGVLGLPFDADYHLTSAPAGLGDPDLCDATSPSTCLDPGYWGGPNPPTP